MFSGFLQLCRRFAPGVVVFVGYDRKSIVRLLSHFGL